MASHGVFPGFSPFAPHPSPPPSTPIPNCNNMITHENGNMQGDHTPSDLFPLICNAPLYVYKVTLQGTQDTTLQSSRVMEMCPP